MNPLVKRQEFGQTVYCAWSERETYTRVYGGKAFCADCGDTGHAAVTA